MCLSRVLCNLFLGLLIPPSAGVAAAIGSCGLDDCRIDRQARLSGLCRDQRGGAHGTTRQGGDDVARRVNQPLTADWRHQANGKAGVPQQLSTASEVPRLPPEGGAVAAVSMSSCA